MAPMRSTFRLGLTNLGRPVRLLEGSPFVDIVALASLGELDVPVLDALSVRELDVGDGLGITKIELHAHFEQRARRRAIWRDNSIEVVVVWPYTRGAYLLDDHGILANNDAG